MRGDRFEQARVAQDLQLGCVFLFLFVLDLDLDLGLVGGAKVLLQQLVPRPGCIFPLVNASFCRYSGSLVSAASFLYFSGSDPTMKQTTL